MKKHGYTLAETLITLGIIGIAATLLSPTFRQLIPNREKMEFMECYKLLTNALPAIDYTPGTDDYEYVYKNGEGKVYPTCLGVACVNVASEIKEASSSSVYNWTGVGGESISVNDGHTNYYKNYDVVCKNKKSGNTFTFTLSGEGTITGLDEKGSKFMSDQFNYYKKGDEGEDE